MAQPQSNMLPLAINYFNILRLEKNEDKNSLTRGMRKVDELPTNRNNQLREWTSK